MAKKLISWNVNGIRACINKGWTEFVTENNPDILCIQEIKAKPEQVDYPLELAHYHTYWNPAERPGYSGTLIMTKDLAISEHYGLGDFLDPADNEGRVITLEFEQYFLVNVYTVNSKDKLLRIEYRQQWDTAFLKHMQYLETLGKPVIVCGDLNVAHHEIDIARPDSNHFSPGFSKQERTGFQNFMDANFIDTFRHFHPDTTEAYSWWSYRAGARQRNVGWRIDYFLTSAALKGNLQSAFIMPEVHGSDHCPVGITIEL